MDLGLTYSAERASFEGYTDADWGNCPIDRRAYSGYLFLLNGGPITWDSRKQRTVATSTVEAEYVALSEGVRDAIFQKRFIAELGFPDSKELIVFSDNQGAIALAKNPVHHAKTKHIDIRHHFVRDVFKEKEFDLQYVSTDDQTADFLTKALPRAKHEHCVKLCGLYGL